MPPETPRQPSAQWVFPVRRRLPRPAIEALAGLALSIVRRKSGEPWKPDELEEHLDRHIVGDVDVRGGVDDGR